ncbi:hypothetical protein CSA37_04120 [Candidatus Fermentibacteria bacterium]|nr:MAG: hypothetical protein CSA37_04120 [Candidatus Fermentibacteria bacterium]
MNFSAQNFLNKARVCLPHISLNTDAGCFTEILWFCVVLHTVVSQRYPFLQVKLGEETAGRWVPVP